MENDIDFLRAFICDFTFSSKNRTREDNMEDLEEFLPLLRLFDERSVPLSVSFQNRMATPTGHGRTRQLPFACFDADARQAGRLLFGIPTMGWVQQGVEVGDEVCIIPGFEFPMVIPSTVDNRYRFLGLCFIHGFMDGEMVTKDWLIDGPSLDSNWITVE